MFLFKLFSSGLLMAVSISLFQTTFNEENRGFAKTQVKWAVEKTSTLRVIGKSNVNKFSCEIQGYYETDTLIMSASGTGGSVKLNGSLEINVMDFDCHNKLITGDLRKTLKAKTHPDLIIRFLSLDRAPFSENNNQNINGWVEVELAGVKKLMKIPFEFISQQSTIILMNGKKQFCFSDFELTPPKKLAGVVRIVDEFTVDFRLKLITVK